MLPDFSEFSYGFALTSEFIERFKGLIRIAPHFPTLREEGEEGGGYDVKIEVYGIPIFFQFKRSEYKKGYNAKYRKYFENPYYIFKLKPKSYSKQHKLLLDLEKVNKFVYYSAPAFHKIEQFNYYYYNKKIIYNSIFVEPSSIGELPDNSEHVICFKNSTSNVYFCSEPKEIAGYCGKDLLCILQERLNSENIQIVDNHYLYSLSDKLIEIIKENYDSEETDFKFLPHKLSSYAEKFPLLYVSELARNFFDSQFMIIQKGE